MGKFDQTSNVWPCYFKHLPSFGCSTSQPYQCLILHSGLAVCSTIYTKLENFATKKRLSAKRFWGGSCTDVTIHQNTCPCKVRFACAESWPKLFLFCCCCCVFPSSLWPGRRGLTQRSSLLRTPHPSDLHDIALVPFCSSSSSTCDSNVRLEQPPNG